MTNNDQLTPHFRLSEFRCRCGCGGEKRATIRENLQALASELEKVRAHFGRPVSVHSGYRCPLYNAKIGGVSNSQHRNGRAADISIAGVTPRQIGDWANANLPGIGGIGVYEPPGDVFCHLDTRSRVSGRVIDNTVRDAVRWYE